MDLYLCRALSVCWKGGVRCGGRERRVGRRGGGGGGEKRDMVRCGPRDVLQETAQPSPGLKPRHWGTPAWVRLCVCSVCWGGGEKKEGGWRLEMGCRGERGAGIWTS